MGAHNVGRGLTPELGGVTGKLGPMHHHRPLCTLRFHRWEW
jgi:hypothetical protein